MFSDEPETRQETATERRQRRARHGLDRRGLKQVVLWVVLLWSGMAALVAADVVGIERRLTTVTVIGLVDHRRSRECVTQLLTGYGDAQIYTRNPCRYAAWHVGDKAEVEARQLRFTGTIVVSTHGTIFQGAHSILPES